MLAISRFPFRAFGISPFSLFIMLLILMLYPFDCSSGHFCKFELPMNEILKAMGNAVSSVAGMHGRVPDHNVTGRHPYSIPQRRYFRQIEFPHQRGFGLLKHQRNPPDGVSASPSAYSTRLFDTEPPNQPAHIWTGFGAANPMPALLGGRSCHPREPHRDQSEQLITV
jgi:hypothetical protein